MSRHRNIRSMNVDEEYEGYDDVYGHSVEDDYCVSPSASQYLFDRSRPHQQMSSFFPEEEDISEEPDEDHSKNSSQKTLEKTRERLDSLNIESVVSSLGPEEETLLKSCLDEIHNIVGDSIPENVIIGHIINSKFNIEKALDSCLNETSKKPKISISTNKTLDDKSSSSKKGPGILTKPQNWEIIKVVEEQTAFLKPGEPVKVVSASKAQVTIGFDVRLSKDKDILTPEGGSSRGSSKCSSPTPNQQENSSSSDKIPTPLPSPAPRTPTMRSKFTSNRTGEMAEIEYKKEREGKKDLLNLVVIGHVDAGKSTLMGHLLHDLGQVPKKSMHKFEQESKKLGKQSFLWAWVLDETGEERSRGITMDVGTSRFETETKSIVLLDAPGHKDFIPNMITGASQADVAILVVDSTTGEFETGFESGGQTREHALLVRSLGVMQLIVAVNKLDTVEWKESRFQEIKARLLTFLVRMAGFRENDINFIPCSGLIGENLCQKPQDKRLTDWYSGHSLLNAIDNFKTPERPVKKPLRMTVNDVFKGAGGICLGGRVETGMVAPGDKVLIQPLGEVASVKGVTLDEERGGYVAFAGDPILLTLQNFSSDIYIGSVLCDPGFPIRVTNRFQARIVTFDAMIIPLTRGFSGVLHLASLSEQVSIKKIISQLSKGTGEVIKNKPRCLPKNSNGIVELETTKPICIEEFKDVKELGRFTLRSSGTTIAAGLIIKIL